MNDAEFEAEKNRLDALVTRWKERLGLQRWIIQCEYKRTEGTPTQAGYRTTASTQAEWQYLQAHLEFNCDTSRSMDAEDAELIVVHELCHVLLAPIAELIPTEQNERQEFTTETIARAFVDAWKPPTVRFYADEGY